MSELGPAEAYGRHVGRYGTELADAFARFARIRSDMQALDVGCGPGALTEELARAVGPERDDPAAVDPPQEPDSVLELDSARESTACLADKEHDQVSRREDVLDLDPQLLPPLQPAVEHLAHRDMPPLGALERVRRRDPLDLRVEEIEDRGELPAVVVVEAVLAASASSLSPRRGAAKALRQIGRSQRRGVA